MGGGDVKDRERIVAAARELGEPDGREGEHRGDVDPLSIAHCEVEGKTQLEVEADADAESRREAWDPAHLEREGGEEKEQKKEQEKEQERPKGTG